MMFTDLETTLFACNDSSSRRLEGGARLIRHLPDKGPLAYLHYLYAPATDELLGQMRDGLDREVPSEFGAFLRYANGACLFDKCIYLYGPITTFSRSLDPDRQVPIDIIFDNRVFAATQPDRWAAEWIRIGSVTGWDSRFSLEAHASGKCAITREDGAAAEYTGFMNMLSRIIGRIGPLIPCDGADDDTYAEIEKILPSLIRTH